MTYIGTIHRPLSVGHLTEDTASPLLYNLEQLHGCFVNQYNTPRFTRQRVVNTIEAACLPTQ